MFHSHSKKFKRSLILWFDWNTLLDVIYYSVYVTKVRVRKIENTQHSTTHSHMDFWIILHVLSIECRSVFVNWQFIIFDQGNHVRPSHLNEINRVKYTNILQSTTFNSQTNFHYMEKERKIEWMNEFFLNIYRFSVKMLHGIHLHKARTHTYCCLSEYIFYAYSSTRALNSEQTNCIYYLIELHLTFDLFWFLSIRNIFGN